MVGQKHMVGEMVVKMFGCGGGPRPEIRGPCSSASCCVRVLAVSPCFGFSTVRRCFSLLAVHCGSVVGAISTESEDVGCSCIRNGLDQNRLSQNGYGCVHVCTRRVCLGVCVLACVCFWRSSVTNARQSEPSSITRFGPNTHTWTQTYKQLPCGITLRSAPASWKPCFVFRISAHP